MQGEGYHTTQLDETHRFSFQSEGPNGVIKKIVEFTPYPGGMWNLAFGDATKDDGFDCRVVSNNHDLRKVIQTVANTIHIFTRKYPDRKVFIVPADEKRGTLYNTVFRRYWSAIQPAYEVMGLTGITFEPYSPDNEYDIFIVT